MVRESAAARLRHGTDLYHNGKAVPIYRIEIQIKSQIEKHQEL